MNKKLIKYQGGAGRRAIAPLHWHVDQNAEQEKYHDFSTFETNLCSGGMDLNSNLRKIPRF